MTTITCSGVQNGDQTSYTEGDYTFTTPASTGAADGLARVAGNTGNSFGLDDTGIPTIYEDGQNAPVDFGQLANNNGSAFTISSVDVNQLAANASATQTETFTGVRADGTTVSENFTVDTNPNAFQTFNLSGFNNLVSFDYNAGSNNSILTQLKNFVVNTDPAGSFNTTPTVVNVNGPATGINPGTRLDIYINNGGSLTPIGTATVEAATPGSTNGGTVAFSTTIPAYLNPTPANVVVFNGATQVAGLTTNVTTPVGATGATGSTGATGTTGSTGATGTRGAAH